MPQTIAPYTFAQGTVEPTGSPLPRPMSLHRIESVLKAILPGVFWQLTVSGKYGRLGAPLSILIERLGYPTPLLALAVVDLGWSVLMENRQSNFLIGTGGLACLSVRSPHPSTRRFALRLPTIRSRFRLA